MQLPGMSTQPVRVSLEVTWHPHDDTWSLSRRAWRQDAEHRWQLEEMQTSGTPLMRRMLLASLDELVSRLVTEIEESADPFGDAGPFVS